MDTSFIQTQIEEIEKKIRDTEALLSDPSMASLAKEEIENLKKQLEELQKALDSIAAIKKENPVAHTFGDRNVILEVKGAAGGDEAKIWAKELLRMYLKYAEQKKLRTEVLDDWTCKISGNPPAPIPSGPAGGPFALFKYEAGVHRVQRVPETEKRGRIHTSTAVIYILPELE